MFSYYSAVIFIALFSMSIMIVVVQENDIMPERKKHGFVLTFSLVLVVAIAEWIGVCLDGAAHLQLLHIAAKVI
ncbi:MAG: hypothetical protein LKJ90_00610 [Faecalibacterium sp.]|jgi:hypothetical protein|nr:hypothetical protein [Faecalibacterium sp.]